MNDTASSRTDHTINVRSVQVYHGAFDSSFIESDGHLRDTARDLEFHEEKSLSFECSCGERFRKWNTAIEHLRSADTERNHND